jgi:aminoglycoside phosphotransferase (APT) family kinase protein
VAWLRPTDVVAKVGIGHTARLETELQIARGLQALGAPVVSPAPELPVAVHYRNGLAMTFWRYHPQDAAREFPPETLAGALKELHGALGRLPPQLTATLPSFMAEPLRVRALLDDATALPALTSADRDLLRDTFDRLRTSLESTNGLVPIHGSPHSYNVLSVDAAPAFIDFETACLGPLEWDLAHVDEQVEPFFSESLRPDVLRACRSMVSVTTAALCAADIERGDLREHAAWHLANLRESAARVAE